MAKEMVKQQDRGVEGQKQRPMRARMLTPPVDVLENDDEYLICADMPGVESKDMSIELKAGELTIRAPRGMSGHAKDGGGELEYLRIFRVPAGIDANKLSAELNHGVLKLHLPKEEAMKPKRIQIKAG
jgi:HSP20 family molecular chaperone IbpA